MTEGELKNLSYLYFGYDARSIVDIAPPPYECTSHVYNAREAAAVLDKVLDEVFSVYSKFNYCVVPISGGWDSRILLGAAMERLDSKQIKTMTYGFPGQIDYEIGAKIARKFHLEHHAVDLSRINLSWDDLLQSVKVSPWTYVPAGFFNHFSISRIASANDIVLSGFLGDILSGSKFSIVSTIEDEREDFISWQQRQKLVNLLPLGFDVKSLVPKYLGVSNYSYRIVYNLGIRQASCVASIVTPTKKWHQWGIDVGISSCGARFIAPFANPVWASYWLSVPVKVLYRQKLYINMIRLKFPELANMPSSHLLGCTLNTKFFYPLKRGYEKLYGGLKKIFPSIKLRKGGTIRYVESNKAFRERRDYKDILDIACNYLHKNNVVPWLDLKQLTVDHMNCKANYGSVFFILIGLALNLQNESKIEL
jgi:hypothetical protein